MAKYWFFEIKNAPQEIENKNVKLEGDEITVGRISMADFPLPWDKKVSKMHAKLELIESGVKVIDLNSTNGTYILEDYKLQKVESFKDITLPAVVKFGDTVVTISYGQFIDSNTKAVTQSLLMSMPEALDDKRMQESILVLDQCGSSSLAGEEGDKMAFHLKKRLFQFCDSVLKECSPAYTKNTGDGFFATFSSTESCLDAAIKILKRLDQRNTLTDNPPIDVRIGLHSGETFLMDKTSLDRHGNDVNTAFRIEGVTSHAFTEKTEVSLPEKNRIVVSKRFLEEYPGDKSGFLSLGKAGLKGIKEPVELYLYQIKL